MVVQKRVVVSNSQSVNKNFYRIDSKNLLTFRKEVFLELIKFSFLLFYFTIMKE